MIVNKFKMRSNVVTYNLSGMGCSAGVIAISLARDLLQVLLGRVGWVRPAAPGSLLGGRGSVGQQRELAGASWSHGCIAGACAA